VSSPPQPTPSAISPSPPQPTTPLATPAASTPTTSNPQPVTTRSAADRAKDYTIDLGDGEKLEMVWIPAGTFQMGSDDGHADEKPVHTVELDGFWMGKYEVTERQYATVMGKSASFSQGPNRATAEGWDDATEFCRKLSAATGENYTLPTEAQWEYACRAGSSGKWCFGDDISQLDNYAWYRDNAGWQTHDVGQKKPNAWGLYDMHGNRSEYCTDEYHASYYKVSPRRNPPGPQDGIAHVERGGSSSDSANQTRSANRPDWEGSAGVGGLVGVWVPSGAGFRVCRLPQP
jgi:formylglycine-generating enzyme required for sulfatase activity